jgi:2-C-methyl-D-erythritol 2,4-cyclodiphosphate synthase
MPPPRIGIGYDLHRLEPAVGGSIILAGIRIPCPCRLIAHSDGDVVLHAVADALLGAMALGDLGTHFPSDARNRGRASTGLVAEVLAMPAFTAVRPLQVDVNVILEAPRLAPHLAAMRASLAAVLDLPADRCSIKARTNEGVDAVGRGEAVAAHAVVLLADRTVAGDQA